MGRHLHWIHFLFFSIFSERKCTFVLCENMIILCEALGTFQHVGLRYLCALCSNVRRMAHGIRWSYNLWIIINWIRLIWVIGKGSLHSIWYLNFRAIEKQQQKSVRAIKPVWNSSISFFQPAIGWVSARAIIQFKWKAWDSCWVSFCSAAFQNCGKHKQPMF